MTKQEVKEKVDATLIDFYYGCEPDNSKKIIPEPNKDLIEFGFDDLDAIEFIMCIEENFDIMIDDEDAANKLNTLQEFYDYVFDKVNSKKEKEND